MSLQDDCNDHHQCMYDAYEAWVQAHQNAYTAAQAAGMGLSQKIAWEVAFGMAQNAMLNCCNKAKLAGNSVPGVTVASAPGPKTNDPLA